MKTAWSVSDNLLEDSRFETLAEVLITGKYYDIKTFRGTKGCQIFQGIEGTRFVFFDQFAHDGFGGNSTYEADDFIRVWE